MKILFLIFVTIWSNVLFGQVHVRGYYRSNGTYVQPHERTRPNSTVTDNYSYPGNYNPNITTTTPTPNYNIGNSSSSATTSNVWVNGYYRGDGTYVSGYYRNTPSDNNTSSSNITSTTPTYQYVKTKKVNVRANPSAYSEVYTTLDLNQSVKSIYTVDNWTKVEIRKYDSYSNSYETVYGYIKSTLLNDSYTTTYNNDIYSTANSYRKTLKNKNNKYTVISLKAYFYKKPDKDYIKNAYLLYGEEIKSIKESTYYIYIIFKNIYGQTTKGWINKDDLQSL